MSSTQKNTIVLLIPLICEALVSVMSECAYLFDEGEHNLVYLVGWLDWIGKAQVNVTDSG